MKRRGLILAPAVLAVLLMSSSQASAQIVYQFRDATTGLPLVSPVPVTAGQVFNFRVYLQEGPPATNINSQGGLGTSGVAVTAGGGVGVLGTPNSTGTPWGSSNTAGSSSTRAVLSLLTFNAVTADATGAVWLGNFSYTVGATPVTLTAADQNPAVGDNTSHFDPPFNGLDSLIAPGTLTLTTVPEPTSLALCGLVAGLTGWRMRRKAIATVAA